MSEHGWQWQSKVTVPGGGTATVTLSSGRPLLERLTIWTSSGNRVLTNMSHQVRINGKSYGAAVAIVGAKAADVVVDSGTTGRIFPRGVTTGVVDPFVLDVLLTNAGLSPEDVTIYFAAVGRDGGPTT